ncbi:GntR family transcriptional regulator [Nonomuraea sp. NPDC050310]|uniref:GntR family transcriptional regulator n=1 Tax=Nonomuraea sp. NPDC050310 TaxID=3154935 RepID=UPI0033E06E97
MDRDRYLQVADDLRKRIEAGEYEAGARLPAVPALAERYGVARGTAHQAVQALAKWGMVISKSGSGTFVRTRLGARQLIRCYDRMRQSGAPITSGLDSVMAGRSQAGYRSETVYAEPDVRLRLGLGDPDLQDRPDVMATDALYHVNDEPTMIIRSWEPLALTRGTEVVFPLEGPLGGRGVIERMAALGLAVDATREVVRARAASPEEGAQLLLPPGGMVLTIERTFYAGERPVETADYVFPCEQIELSYAWRIDPLRPAGEQGENPGRNDLEATRRTSTELDASRPV